MRRYLRVAATACILLSLLESCHTHKKHLAAKSSGKSRFINDVYINGHNRNDATVARSKGKGKNSDHSSRKHDNSRNLKPGAIKRKYAEVLGVKPKEISNYPLYQFIDRWYGTNYRLGGQSKDGIDCSGFAQKLYNEVYGINLLRTAMEQFSSCKRIKNAKDAEEGDLVFFKIQSKRITHVGVYLANNYFVHSSTSGGVVISNLNEDYWHKYYAGVGRVPKR